MILRMNFVRTAGEAWQAARRAPGALAAGIVRSGPGAGRDVREWETDMECASDPDGLAAGVGALPRARRTAQASGLLALLAATALLALAAPAQAQTEIWSATLTPQDLGNRALGCDSTEDNTAFKCSNTAVLSDNDFTLGSTAHTIGFIELTDESLQIIFTGVFTDADTLVLVLGTTSLAFSDGIVTTGSGDGGRIWFSPGISWTARTDVSVRLISLTAPGAPTGLAATANGPSQIDLAWTAPVNTGGSAITGYTIEVSPDGSSWSDLVPDTASTDTAYAHMGLDPATTRHYRVSAINAVGTSDASGSDDTTTNTAPTGAPTITGTAQVGQTLTAGTAAIMDADGLTSVSYTYQWIRVATDNTETNIAAATATYTLVAADQGTTVKVTVSFTDDASNPETLTSAATAAVAAAPNTPATGAPTITGTAQVGQTLTAVTTAIMDANGLTTPSYTYQWIRVATDNTETNIAAATATYTLVAADQGTTVKVRVSFADDASNAETLTSAATAAVAAAANTLATGAPTITGTAQVGQTLTAGTAAIMDADGLTTPSYTYQWIRVATDNSETNIASATASAYTLVAADQGTTVKVRVSFTDDASNAETLTSAATAAVAAAPNTLATGAPTITGTAQVGQTLTAGTAAIMDADGLTSVSYTYQWIRVATDNTETNIASATASTYTLVAADQGTTVKVRVSFTDDASNAETLTSAATATVSAAPNTLATGAPTIGVFCGTAWPGESTMEIAGEDWARPAAGAPANSSSRSPASLSPGRASAAVWKIAMRNGSSRDLRGAQSRGSPVSGANRAGQDGPQREAGGALCRRPRGSTGTTGRSAASPPPRTARFAPLAGGRRVGCDHHGCRVVA